MNCPTCKEVMVVTQTNNLNEDVEFWCNGCGTAMEVDVMGEPQVSVPELVRRCRHFNEELKNCTTIKMAKTFWNDVAELPHVFGEEII